MAVLSLLAFALLAAAVAHTQGPYGFENPVFAWLGAPSGDRAWARVAELLGTPVIAVALVVTFVAGLVSRKPVRVTACAAFGLAALVANDEVVKPLVQRSYVGELSFPSGNVTAVCAAALVVWLALTPLLGRRAGHAVLVLGAAWTLAMAVAVVGAQWHTPLDDVGSVLLSVGIVGGGAAVFDHAAARGTRRATRRRHDEPPVDSAPPPGTSIGQ